MGRLHAGERPATLWVEKMVKTMLQFVDAFDTNTAIILCSSSFGTSRHSFSGSSQFFLRVNEARQRPLTYFTQQARRG
jgi:hypothetical protein